MEAVVELAKVLQNSEVRITKEEKQFLRPLRYRVWTDSLGPGFIGGSAVWWATRALNRTSRAIIVGGVSWKCFWWGLNRTCDSFAERVLSWDGSRMQHEMSKIVLQKYGNDPKKEKLLSKFFYVEQVFDDSSSDHPYSVLRQRNTFLDEAFRRQGLYPNHSGEVDADIDHPSMQKTKETINSESGQVQVTPLFVDPFDSLLGTTQAVDGAEVASAPAPTRVKSSHHKKSRRHRKHRHDQ